jgi:hypothetical protein
MNKTTVYLPAELKDALALAARRRRMSEAELIREGVALAIAQGEAPKPRLPLFASGHSDLAERFDELLEGFGER